ncbi:MAG: hypothetical protein WC225_02130 [Acholeplasmataceae bacterium]|nr:hypothetical protein [Acholeplasmataceae bacterium]
MKKFLSFWARFFLFVWEMIKSMSNVRGVIALFISYMIYQGWAVVFLIVGIITKNAWLIGVGGAVIAFWVGPGTPTIPLVIVTAFFIKRYLLFDRSDPRKLKEIWRELNEKYNQKKQQAKEETTNHPSSSEEEST